MTKCNQMCFVYIKYNNKSSFTLIKERLVWDAVDSLVADAEEVVVIDVAVIGVVGWILVR